DAGVFADGAMHAVGTDDAARLPRGSRHCPCQRWLWFTRLAVMVVPSAKVAVARASVWVRPVRRVGRWTGTLRSVSLRSSTASVVAWDTIRGVGVSGRQVGEADGHRRTVAVADGEPGGPEPLADERVGDVERVEHLERSGMDDGGP